jgi:hypothetical protein
MSAMGDYAAWLVESGRVDSDESRELYRALLARPGRTDVRAWVKTWAK